MELCGRQLLCIHRLHTNRALSTFLYTAAAESQPVPLEASSVHDLFLISSSERIMGLYAPGVSKDYRKGGLG